MSDPYPPNVEFDIDRERLKTYLRFSWLRVWMAVCGGFGALFGLMSIGKFDQAFRTWAEGLTSVALAVGIALGSLLFAFILYFLFNHKESAHFADELRVSVEGPFLRIRQLASDRKLHFRAIVDYAVIQDPFMRYCQIHALQMTTTGGGPTSTITITGVKECLKARDTLSEIDRMRENAP